MGTLLSSPGFFTSIGAHKKKAGCDNDTFRAVFPSVGYLGTPKHREEKYAHYLVTTTTEGKSFGELFWPQRKTFQAGGGYKNPIKTRKTISTTEKLSSVAPIFFGKEKF